MVSKTYAKYLSSRRGKVASKSQSEHLKRAKKSSSRKQRATANRIETEQADTQIKADNLIKYGNEDPLIPKEFIIDDKKVSKQEFTTAKQSKIDELKAGEQLTTTTTRYDTVYEKQQQNKEKPAENYIGWFDRKYKLNNNQITNTILPITSKKGEIKGYEDTFLKQNIFLGKNETITKEDIKKVNKTIAINNVLRLKQKDKDLIVLNNQERQNILLESKSKEIKQKEKQIQSQFFRSTTKQPEIKPGEEGNISFVPIIKNQFIGNKKEYEKEQEKLKSLQSEYYNIFYPNLKDFKPKIKPYKITPSSIVESIKVATTPTSKPIDEYVGKKVTRENIDIISRKLKNTNIKAFENKQAQLKGTTPSFNKKKELTISKIRGVQENVGEFYKKEVDKTIGVVAGVAGASVVIGGTTTVLASKGILGAENIAVSTNIAKGVYGVSTGLRLSSSVNNIKEGNYIKGSLGIKDVGAELLGLKIGSTILRSNKFNSLLKEKINKPLFEKRLKVLEKNSLVRDITDPTRKYNIRYKSHIPQRTLSGSTISKEKISFLKKGVIGKQTIKKPIVNIPGYDTTGQRKLIKSDLFVSTKNGGRVAELSNPRLLESEIPFFTGDKRIVSVASSRFLSGADISVSGSTVQTKLIKVGIIKKPKFDFISLRSDLESIYGKTSFFDTVKTPIIKNSVVKNTPIIKNPVVKVSTNNKVKVITKSPGSRTDFSRIGAVFENTQTYVPSYVTEIVPYKAPPSIISKIIPVTVIKDGIIKEAVISTNFNQFRPLELKSKFKVKTRVSTQEAYTIQKQLTDTLVKARTKFKEAYAVTGILTKQLQKEATLTKTKTKEAYAEAEWLTKLGTATKVAVKEKEAYAVLDLDSDTLVKTKTITKVKERPRVPIQPRPRRFSTDFDYSKPITKLSGFILPTLPFIILPKGKKKKVKSLFTSKSIKRGYVPTSKSAFLGEFGNTNIKLSKTGLTGRRILKK